VFPVRLLSCIPAVAFAGIAGGDLSQQDGLLAARTSAAHYHWGYILHDLYVHWLMISALIRFTNKPKDGR
jgi:hypothetical protein